MAPSILLAMAIEKNFNKFHRQNCFYCIVASFGCRATSISISPVPSVQNGCFYALFNDGKSIFEIPFRQNTIGSNESQV